MISYGIIIKVLLQCTIASVFSVHDPVFGFIEDQKVRFCDSHVNVARSFRIRMGQKLFN